MNSDLPLIPLWYTLWAGDHFHVLENYSLHVFYSKYETNEATPAFGTFIWYVRKILQKSNTSYPLTPWKFCVHTKWIYPLAFITTSPSHFRNKLKLDIKTTKSSVVYIVWVSFSFQRNESIALLRVTLIMRGCLHTDPYSWVGKVNDKNTRMTSLTWF